MAKDKKAKKKSNGGEKLELIAGPTTNGDGAKKSKKDSSKKDARQHGGLDGLARLADHPLIGDLLAVGALAAVAAIVESGKGDSAKAKSGAAVKSAGKAAAAAIGARLLKEMAAGGNGKKNA